MAVAFRQGVSDGNAASASLVDLTWPGAVPPDNDRMIAVIGVITQTTITPPTGWVLLGQQDAGSSLRMWAYYRDAASEPASNQFSLASATKGWGYIGSYSGVDLSAAPGFSSVNSSGSSLVLPVLAVPEQGWLISTVTGRHANTGALTTFTIDDASAVERFEFASNVTGSNDASGVFYDSNRGLTAASISRTVTASQTESLAGLMQLSLAPSGGTPPPPPPPPAGTGGRWGIHF